ncbi:mechanosensitive ion channel family protein [Pseudogemmobacter bohemicus]|uniref:mechanosensitive ion channel family protein n=1 Tax=Pseudogemmobacter bohemicus TaxID=2250708 RepID=UPI000DD38AD0|nr:mechanosensitive ion channel family protein [Pseudogemmobacter bohemicus]
METIQHLASDYPWTETLFWLVTLTLAALFVNFVVKVALVRLLNRLIAGITALNGPDVVKSGVIARLANTAPTLVISSWIMAVPGLPLTISTVIRNVANAVTILFVAMAIAAALNLAETIWRRRHGGSGKSVKGFVQIAVIAVYIVAVILMIAAVLDRSPVILLSGIGALSAVLILVFQDTLLSLVASLQISSTGIVRVGDWLEMPSMQADGEVVDLALYNVTVRNWDMTYATFPIRKLVTDPFRNWRGMTESGGRRIKRSLLVDQGSIRFLGEDELRRLHTLRRLTPYFDSKHKELEAWNAELGEAAKVAGNRRRLTNIGSFRAYVEAYLKAHPRIRQDMTLLVRHLAPDQNGLPVEIYCFTATTAWGDYEAIQADIFDHLIAIMPEFGLSVLQSPSGGDIRALAGPIEAAMSQAMEDAAQRQAPKATQPV